MLQSQGYTKPAVQQLYAYLVPSACCSLPQDLEELGTAHKGTHSGKCLAALSELTTAAISEWRPWMKKGHVIISTAHATHDVHVDRAPIPVNHPETDLGRLVKLVVGSQVAVVTFDS
jgi:hypothetical protein